MARLDIYRKTFLQTIDDLVTLGLIYHVPNLIQRLGVIIVGVIQCHEKGIRNELRTIHDESITLPPHP